MVNKLKEKLDIGNCLHVNKSKALHCIREKKKNLWRSRWFHCQTQPLLPFSNRALQMERFPQSFRIILCIHLLNSLTESLWNGKIHSGEKSGRWLYEFSIQVDLSDFFFFVQYVSLCCSYVDSFRSFAAVTSWFRDYKEAAWFLGTSWKNLNCCLRV